MCLGYFKASPGSTSASERTQSAESKLALWTIFVSLLALWLLELITSCTIGGFIHIPLVLALVVLVVRLVQGRRVLYLR